MQKRIQFTGPFKNTISFDKKEIRKRIILPTFKDARRNAGIYDALLHEFYEEGCPTSAKYFKILIDKECVLYKTDSIRDRISDNPKLLLNLFDNCKMAEKAVLSGQSNGPLICTRLLLQCILAIKNYDTKYDWILLDAFRIIVKITDKVCQTEVISMEPLCELYYYYGIHLNKYDLKEAVKYLEKSFVLARGTNWFYMEEYRSLHLSSMIAKVYASALLNYANDVFSTTPAIAINQVQEALVILTTVGIERNKAVYIRGNLDMAEFQLKAANYERSLIILENIIKYISSHVQEHLEYLRFLSRYSHIKGVCFRCLKKYDVALVELYKSLEMIRQLNMKKEEGIVLLDIAKVYIERGCSEYRMAESCLRQSKDIFVALNDVFNIKKTSYIMANLKVYNVQPLILDLIKFSAINYCDKYRLIHWKSLCLPFWRNLQISLLNEESYSHHCILNAIAIPDKKSKRKSFQRQAPQV